MGGRAAGADVAPGPGECGGGDPGVPRGSPVAPMRCRCAGGEATLLRPGRAAHTVALKSRQHVSVLRDLQWK